MENKVDIDLSSHFAPGKSALDFLVTNPEQQENYLDPGLKVRTKRGRQVKKKWQISKYTDPDPGPENSTHNDPHYTNIENDEYLAQCMQTSLHLFKPALTHKEMLELNATHLTLARETRPKYYFPSPLHPRQNQCQDQSLY